MPSRRDYVLTSSAFAVFGSLLVLALAACGGESGNEGGVDEGGVRDTVEAYLAALADRDGAQACGRLTAGGQEALVTRSAQAGGPSEGCAKAASSYIDIFGLSLDDVDVRDIEVSGDEATAVVDAAKETYRLRAEGGEWKIDAIEQR